MRIAIVGSRDFTNYTVIRKFILDYLDNLSNVTEIVSGGARGVDSLARQFAEEFDIPIKEFCADWEAYGKSAGMRRNQEIVDYLNDADMCFAFPAQFSRGTRDTIRRVLTANKTKEKPIILKVFEVLV